MRGVLAAQAVKIFENLESFDEVAMKARCESATSHPRFHLDVMNFMKKPQLEKEENY